MFLSIDVGNTNIVFGIRNNKGIWGPVWRMNTSPRLDPTTFEKNVRFVCLENGIGIHEINAVGISSVVPEINPGMEEFVYHLFGYAPVFMGPDLYAGLKVKTNKPYEIGTDLMANAVAAYAFFEQACIIVDFGTALTFTVVDNKGEILGVNIAPGIQPALKMLSGQTAQLPEVPMQMPSAIIGTNTTEAIQSGVMIGYIGMVKEHLSRIKEAAPSQSFKIIATGGMSSVLTPLESVFDLIQINLTLEGIYLSIV